uniref:Cell wall protein-like n=1 Tax=Oryza sativa subsp. japonica TaxID=39947 RepID=Q6Z1T9_ORYSJ|nr:cell wall protein-like [Oryza sativa Japonica Group]BAD27755.1 cell wall protein-like [Oryza sativa Japonica Group]
MDISRTNEGYTSCGPHLPWLRDAALIPGITSSSPEFRRNTVARAGLSFLLVDVSSGSPFRRARASAGAAVPSLGVAASPSTPAAPRFRRNTVAAPASPSSTSPASFRPPLPPPRLVGLLHLYHLRHRSRDVVLGLASPPTEHRRGVFHAILASVQPLPAALVVSSPAPVVVVVVLSSFPVVVAFVPPSSRSRPPPAFRQVCNSPVVIFVLASASSSLVPAVSRLRPRIAAEVVPSPSAAPVRRCRSHASSRGGKDPSSRCPVLVLLVSPRTRCAVVDPARVVSSGVRLSATRLG